MARATRSTQRNTRAATTRIARSPQQKAKLESANALAQFDLTIDMIEHWNQPGRKFRLEPSHILQLHKTALNGLDVFAGTYRPGDVSIGASKHTPPPAHLVAGLVQEMADYVNKAWRRASPVHLCAYVMWRMNWIHPFTDGNGRTARAAAYLVLCTRLGYRLPGANTVPEQIAANKDPYYKALEHADRAATKGKVDVSAMEKLLDGMLAKQLLDLHNQAVGGRSAGRTKPARKRLH